MLVDPSEALGGDGNPLTDVFQWLSRKFLERSKQLELEKNLGMKKIVLKIRLSAPFPEFSLLKP